MIEKALSPVPWCTSPEFSGLFITSTLLLDIRVPASSSASRSRGPMIVLRSIVAFNAVMMNSSSE
jgi:hypothetical protein